MENKVFCEDCIYMRTETALNHSWYYCMCDKVDTSTPIFRKIKKAIMCLDINKNNDCIYFKKKEKE